MTLPAVLEVVPANAPGATCHCLCRARHGGRMGVCDGVLDDGGVRVMLNSMYALDGVLVCRSCALMWPDLPLS